LALEYYDDLKGIEEMPLNSPEIRGGTTAKINENVLVEMAVGSGVWVVL
jgi:hypothetical protein